MTSPAPIPVVQARGTHREIGAKIGAAQAAGVDSMAQEHRFPAARDAAA